MIQKCGPRDILAHTLIMVMSFGEAYISNGKYFNNLHKKNMHLSAN